MKLLTICMLIGLTQGQYSYGRSGARSAAQIRGALADKLTSRVERARFRMADFWQRAGIKLGTLPNYERLGRGKWFTSSLSGEFARTKIGRMDAVSADSFGKVSAWSDLGSGIHYDTNQDAYAVFRQRGELVLVVIDGISTGGAGEIATEVAVETLRSELGQRKLSEVFTDIPQKLYARGFGNRAVPLSYGAVALGVEVRRTQASVSHSGDARLLQIRDGQVIFHTADHNFTYHEVLHGEMTPEEYVQDETRKSLVNRALKVTTDYERAKQMVEHTRIQLSSGDTLVLASDAVWNLFTNTEVAEMVAGRSPRAAVANVRIQVARRVGESDKRDDNFTIIVYHHDPARLLER